MKRRGFLKAAGLTVGLMAPGLCFPGKVIASGDPAMLPGEFTKDQLEIFPSNAEFIDPPQDSIEQTLSDVVIDYEPDLNNDAFCIDLWSEAGLQILNDRLQGTVSGCIHRDYTPCVAQYGDVVHVRYPAPFKRYEEYDWETDTKRQGYDGTLNNHLMPLDNLLYSSFVIKDGEQSRSFPELVELHLKPAMAAMVGGLDMLTIDNLHSCHHACFVGKSPSYALVQARSHLRETVPYYTKLKAAVPPSWQVDFFKNSLDTQSGFDILDNLTTKAGFAFPNEGVVLVNRPLTTPHPYNGLEAKVASHNDLSLRVRMEYDIQTAGTRVIYDMLCGITIVNPQNVYGMYIK